MYSVLASKLGITVLLMLPLFDRILHQGSGAQRSEQQASVLPMFSAGLPGAVQKWLQVAAVPVVPLDVAGLMIGPSSDNVGRLVLFDSRQATGRLQGWAAQVRGLKTIDVARSLDRDFRHATTPAGHRRARTRFFDRLKSRIEAAGGLWARIGDYPYPYQSAFCAAGRPYSGELSCIGNAFAPLCESSDQTRVAVPRTGAKHVNQTVGENFSVIAADFAQDIDAFARQQYRQGRPLYSQSGRSADPSQITFQNGEQFPLLWKTTFDDFSRWWRVRANIELRIQKINNVYHIDSFVASSKFRPTLEIWKGNHLATIPITSGHMQVHDGGLAFRHETRKHPGGFAFRWYEDAFNQNASHTSGRLPA